MDLSQGRDRDQEIWDRREAKKLEARILLSRWRDACTEIRELNRALYKSLLSSYGRITPREDEVLQLLQAWPEASNKDIADLMGIAVRTVKLHVSSILSKLALRSRIELAMYNRKK